MTDWPHKLHSGVCRIRAPILASILMTLGGWASPASAGDVIAIRSAEEVRQDLFDFIEIQESLLQTLELIQVTDPLSMQATKLQFKLVSLMSPKELMIFAESSLPLDDLNATLSEDMALLALSLKNAEKSTSYGGDTRTYSKSGALTGLVPDTSRAPHIDSQDCADAADANGYVDPNSAFRKPPGYCNQTDMIPVNRDPNTGMVNESQEYRLSDVGYPAICPLNNTPGVIALAEDLVVKLNFANQLIGKGCQQEAGGFNGSTACVVVVLALRLGESLLEQVGYCTGVRRNSEGGALYARLGEIFVQGNAHYQALSTTNDFIQTATTELDTNVGGNITKMGDEVSEDLKTNIGNVEVKIADIQPTIDENAEKLSFTQLNNAAIEYKIWCDKQRPYLRPSDCE
jgi:hypothetical protein